MKHAEFHQLFTLWMQDADGTVMPDTGLVPAGTLAITNVGFW